MTLGNMRGNGVRSLAVSCWQCHHQAVLSADILNGATFCAATQGVGTLDWHGLEFGCDQADTNE
jgi:hypothetical protein